MTRQLHNSSNKQVLATRVVNRASVGVADRSSRLPKKQAAMYSPEETTKLSTSELKQLKPAELFQLIANLTAPATLFGFFTRCAEELITGLYKYAESAKEGSLDAYLNGMRTIAQKQGKLEKLQKQLKKQLNVLFKLGAISQMACQAVGERYAAPRTMGVFQEAASQLYKGFEIPALVSVFKAHTDLLVLSKQFAGPQFDAGSANAPDFYHAVVPDKHQKTPQQVIGMIERFLNKRPLSKVIPVKYRQQCYDMLVSLSSLANEDALVGAQYQCYAALEQNIDQCEVPPGKAIINAWRVMIDKAESIDVLSGYQETLENLPLAVRVSTAADAESQPLSP